MHHGVYRTAVHRYLKVLPLFSFAYLEYTAADLLLFIAAAHTFAPVLIFSARTSRAVRFVAADARCSKDPKEIDSPDGDLVLRGGYVDAAQLRVLRGADGSNGADGLMVTGYYAEDKTLLRTTTTPPAGCAI